MRDLLSIARSARSESPYPRWLISDLRSDHAGETGAVWIYKGALWVARGDELRAEIRRHLAHEERHLAALEIILARHHRSRLLFPWWVCGMLLGIIGAALGARLHHVTVEAVETFVDQHYTDQIERLQGSAKFHATQQLLQVCRVDEISHCSEAAKLVGTTRSFSMRIWGHIVGFGSRAAVFAARRI